MRSGLTNKTISQTGEFAVCAQLGKLGLVATPFAGNVPHFDVIVTDEALNTLPIQVKANYGNTDWISDVREWLKITYTASEGKQTISGYTDLLHPELIFIYVYLSRSAGQQDRFFILTKRDVQRIVFENYKPFLLKHGGRRPRKPDSFHATITLANLSPHENNWDIIRGRLTVSANLRGQDRSDS